MYWRKLRAATAALLLVFTSGCNGLSRQEIVGMATVGGALLGGGIGGAVGKNVAGAIGGALLGGGIGYAVSGMLDLGDDAEVNNAATKAANRAAEAAAQAAATGGEPVTVTVTSSDGEVFAIAEYDPALKENPPPGYLWCATGTLRAGRLHFAGTDLGAVDGLKGRPNPAEAELGRGLVVEGTPSKDEVQVVTTCKVEKPDSATDAGYRHQLGQLVPAATERSAG